MSEEQWQPTSCCPDWPLTLPCPACGEVAELSKECYDWPSSKKWACANGHFGKVYGLIPSGWKFYRHDAATTAAPES
jgi:hypothetical protein